MKIWIWFKKGGLFMTIMFVVQLIAGAIGLTIISSDNLMNLNINQLLSLTLLIFFGNIIFQGWLIEYVDNKFKR